MDKDLVELILVVVGGILFLTSALGVYLYYSKKAVFFADRPDMILTIAGFWILPILGWAALQILCPGGPAQLAALIFLLLGAVVYLGYVFHRAYSDNRQTAWVVAPVGISKIVFAICSVIAVVGVVVLAIGIVMTILDKLTGGKKKG